MGVARGAVEVATLGEREAAEVRSDFDDSDGLRPFVGLGAVDVVDDDAVEVFLDLVCGADFDALAIDLVSFAFPFYHSTSVNINDKDTISCVYVHGKVSIRMI
jgi:hypothetical protein